MQWLLHSVFHIDPLSSDNHFMLVFYRCVTRPGGRMLLGVPMAHDEVQFNGARIYGPLQVCILGGWSDSTQYMDHGGKISNS